MQTLKAGVLYFAVVFGAGFVLGPIRVIWLAPRFGTRAAERMEMPIMLAVIIFAARWIVRRPGLPPARLKRLGVGVVALALLLIAELTLVLWLRRLTIHEYIASRDPVAGTVYIGMLGAFAIMPLLLTRR
jgi:hypothetical protein